jgi:glycerol-3-phosphate cytidylyltransferase
MSADKKIVGFVAGAFDLLHPGYIHMFSDIEQYCDYLIVGLHEDPSLERPEKLKPILKVNDRQKMLTALQAVDLVIPYKTETDLYEILKHTDIDIRFLGSDYVGSDYTGNDLGIPLQFVNREHGWSTTKLKNMIANSITKG